MFNFWGTHKIGILGDCNSGKTVFLTSLLWNLEEGTLKLGEKGVTPKDVKILRLPKDEHPFDYEGNKRYFKNKNAWPAKTLEDFSLAKCSYRLSSFFKRDLTFVDIPGERMADILIWLCSSYEEWSEELFRSWRESDVLSEYMKDFVDSVSESEMNSQDADEEDTENVGTDSANLNCSIEELSWKYKTCMRCLVNNYNPQITPSSLFFHNGEVATLDDVNNDAWLRQRSIWQDGSCDCGFFPLPEDFCEKNQEIYETCRNNYHLYRHKVVKPLFAQLGSCDHFIICIDVLGILAKCPEAFLQSREELRHFFEKVTPSFWEHLFHYLDGNRPRVAFVATKSDKVYGKNLQRLKNLLEDMVKKFATEKIKFGYYTCTAWPSTSEGKNDMRGQARGRYAFEEQGESREMMVPLKCADLPSEWPSTWNGEDYKDLERDILPSRVVAKPPRQTGIDTVLNFVTGDGKE